MVQYFQNEECLHQIQYNGWTNWKNRGVCQFFFINNQSYFHLIKNKSIFLNYTVLYFRRQKNEDYLNKTTVVSHKYWMPLECDRLRYSLIFVKQRMSLLDTVSVLKKVQKCGDISSSLLLVNITYIHYKD